MLEEALTVLAQAGSTAVVAAMATDAWQATRARMACLFHRDGQARQAAVEVQLDGNAALVAQADDADRARRTLAPVWQLELEALLHRHPEAVEEVRAMLTQTRDELPKAQQRWLQANTVSGPGSLFAAQGGNVIVHQVAEGEKQIPDARPAADGSTDS